MQTFMQKLLLLPLVLVSVPVTANYLPNTTWGAGMATIQATQSVDRIIVKLRSGSVQVSNQNESFHSATRYQQRLRTGNSLGVMIQTQTGLAVRQRRASQDNLFVYDLPYNMSSQQAEQYIAQIASNPEVAVAEIDKRYYPATITPNDPDYNQESYLAAYTSSNPVGMNLPSVWSTYPGSTSNVVAIVDTGILAHTDLNSRLVTGQASTAGYDFIASSVLSLDGDAARDANPTDSAYVVHGTEVAGVIGALSNNGIGITGVDWSAQLLIARAIGLNGGYLSDIADAMRWSAGLNVAGVPDNTHPAKVINLSIGGVSGEACSTTEQDAINAVVNAGVTVVVAAGNHTSGSATVTAPGNCQNVITVAALDSTASLASYSNYGSKVSLSAMGTVYTTSSGNSYEPRFGTSFSTPLVSGVVSLMLTANPKLSDGSIPASSIPHLIKQKLQASTRAFPTSSNCTTNICGSGILDAQAAINAIASITDADLATATTQASAVSSTLSANIASTSTSSGGGGALSNLLLALLAGLGLYRQRILHKRFSSNT